MRGLLRKRMVRTGMLFGAAVVLAVGGLGLQLSRHASGATNGIIAFARSDGTNSQIDTIHADGSNMQALTSDGFSNDSPSWSPDGTKILFASDPTNTGIGQLDVMNADGSHRTQLTNNPNGDFAGVWSPDGSRIVFTCNDGTDYQLCVMNADGSNVTTITSGSNQNFEPSWSINNVIAYSCFVSFQQQICSIKPDGSGYAQLTSDAHTHLSPSWSPDGSKLALIYEPTLYSDHLATMNPDGSNLQTINNSATNNDRVSWSPDGTKLVYQNFVSGTDTTTRIYTINIDGSNETALTPNDGNFTNSPSWQPIITNDVDNDGALNSVENAGPNGGDANGDGVLDSWQAAVTTFVNPVTGEYASLQTSCTANSSVQASAESTQYPDNAFSYPAGLMNFTATGCGSPGATATVTEYFYGNYNSSQLVLRKWNPATHAYATVPGAVLSTTTIGGQAVLKATYNVTDGSAFDQEGSANGQIVDPSGPALNAATVPNTGAGGTATTEE